MKISTTTNAAGGTALRTGAAVSVRQNPAVKTAAAAQYDAGRIPVSPRSPSWSRGTFCNDQTHSPTAASSVTAVDATSVLRTAGPGPGPGAGSSSAGSGASAGAGAGSGVSTGAGASSGAGVGGGPCACT